MVEATLDLSEELKHWIIKSNKIPLNDAGVKFCLHVHPETVGEWGV